MQTRTTTLPGPSKLPAPTWSEEEMEDFMWGAGVHTHVGMEGFRKAAYDAFMERGCRLATIGRDFEPFDYIHKLSLYISSSHFGGFAAFGVHLSGCPAVAEHAKAWTPNAGQFQNENCCLYMLGDQPRLGRREAKNLARCVIEKIGLHPKPDECQAEVSGRRLVVTVALPHWAWPRL